MKTLLQSLPLALLAALAVLPFTHGTVAEPAEASPQLARVEARPEVNVCGRCGDGACVKSCGENATSCPVDCGGGGTSY